MGQSYIIDEDRLYNLFKKILNREYSDVELTETQGSMRWKDSDGNLKFMYDKSRNAFLIPRRFYWSFMEYMHTSYIVVNRLFSEYFKERFPQINFDAVLDNDFYDFN